MVSEKKHDGGAIYLCDLCGLGYREQKTARRCEEWCAAHQSCSLEITRNAVYIPHQPASRLTG